MRTRQEHSRRTVLQTARLAADLTYEQLGAILGVTYATAECYCLPPDDARSINWMGRAPAEALRRWSGGDITIDNFKTLTAAPRRARRRRRA